MGNVIKVGMADLNVCVSPDSITTLGLGSCVGIALRDPVTKIGGLAHVMLPDRLTRAYTRPRRARAPARTALLFAIIRIFPNLRIPELKNW